MRRREPEVVAEDVGGVPECLRAGVCLEVWTPPRRPDEWWRPEISAHQAFRHARRLWAQRNGIGPWQHDRMPPVLRRTTTPWSYDFLVREPQLLAQQLRLRGLPEGWTPSPAPAEWREPLPHPEPTFAEEQAAGRAKRTVRARS